MHKNAIEAEEEDMFIIVGMIMMILIIIKIVTMIRMIMIRVQDD